MEGSARAAVESVHSPAVSAHISHAVIATYAAAAVQDVAGVAAVGGGHIGPIERRPDPERAGRGVKILADGDAIDLEVHVVTEWGASIPAVAADVEREVRRYLQSMIDLDVRGVAVLVDDVAPPA